MLLVTLLAGVCASLERSQIQMVKTMFNNCRDLKTSGGTLVDLQATSAVISKMSIVSRVMGRLALLESIDSSVLVKKCAFEGLASYFAHVSGGSVAVTSSSFADSARPLTIEGVLNGGSLGRSLEHANVLACSRVSTAGSYSVSGSTFDGCQPENTKEGGAIHFSGTSLSITKCTFKNCKAVHTDGRWGDAIFSSADIATFVLDGCTFESFDKSKTIAHFKRGETATQFEKLTLSNNIFKSTSVMSDRAGGSGLLIRYPKTLELVGCEFEQCTCNNSGGALMFEKREPDQTVPAERIVTPTFIFTSCIFLDVNTTGGNGGAIALPHACESIDINDCLFQNNRAPLDAGKHGGCLYLAGNLVNLTIKDTTFRKCIAYDGGCISGWGYLDNLLTLDNVTVDKCDSTTYPGYSISLSATTVSISRVHLWNMTSRGLVVLHESPIWSDHFDLYGSSFRNVEIYGLFQTTFSSVSLTDCVFDHCTFFEYYEAPIELSGGSLVMTGCVFTNVNAKKAIAFATGNGECSIEGCSFETVKSESSSMLSLAGFSTVSLKNTTFIDSRTLAQPILKVNVSAVKLFECGFYDCVSDGESMIVLSDCASVNMTLTALKDCSCKSGALVAIADAGSVFMASSCFWGLTERPGGAGYIECTCDNATFELPMCFSMSEAASISIKESSSSSLNYPSTIFNCRDCSFIPDSESGGTDNSPSNGLSVPVIVGIAIGALVLVSLVILIVVLVIRRKKSDQDEKSLDDDLNEMTEEGEVESTITSIMSEEWTQKMTEDARGMTTNGVGMANMIHEPFPEFEEAF